jgi:AraC-like DNA-binding protein
MQNSVKLLEAGPRRIYRREVQAINLLPRGTGHGIQLRDKDHGLIRSARSIYRLIREGLNVGLVSGGLADITGAQGAGRGADFGISPGTGAATLFQVIGKHRRGPRKGLSKRVVVGKRRAVKGEPIGKTARAVGAGLDLDQVRARDLEAWLQPSESVLFETPEGMIEARMLDLDRAKYRAELLDSVQAARAIPEKLQAIAKRAAHKQAERLFHLRGVEPSATSRDDAASEAILAMLSRCQSMDRWTDKVWSNPRVIRVLALYAARAAYLSFSQWANVGMTGDNTTRRGDKRHFTLTDDTFTRMLADAPTDLDQAELFQSLLERGYSLRTLAQVSAWSEPAIKGRLGALGEVQAARESDARRAAARWIFRVGYYAVKRTGAGSGRANDAALSRCRVLAGVALGATITDACARAGFASVQNFVESCKDSGLFANLRADRLARLSESNTVEYHRGNARAYALDVAYLSKQLAKIRGGEIVKTDTLRARRASAYKSARREVAKRAMRAELSTALDRAQYHKRAARRAIDATLADFDRALIGLHSDKWGNLRALTKLTDAKGRARGASKADSLTIRAARGKLARRAPLANTVKVQVGARRLDCAPLA